MNLKRIALALAASCSLPLPAVANPAVAPAPAELTALPDISLEQGRVRDALNGAGLGLEGQRVVIGRRGRQDLVLHTATPADQVFATLKGAWLSHRPLRHGLQVAGWAFINARGSWTFTIQDAATLDSWVAEVSPDGSGARVSISGVKQLWHAPPSALPHIPRRGDRG
jgi:hypothetical protein